MYRVFYSWQSDVPAYGRPIAKALELAAQSLENIKIDSATRDEIGAVEIDNKIFEKIKACDIFVADLSIIGQVGKRRRRSPNPNVLYETGFALGNRGEDRLFLIAQKTPSGSDKFPFDLRNRRIAFYDLEQKGIEKIISRDIQDFLALRLASLPNATATTKVTLKNSRARWDNWSRLLPSFRVDVTVDNFENAKPNFIEDVALVGTDGFGDPWKSTQFLIGDQNINQRFRIEPYDKTDVSVYINEGRGKTSRLRVPMPDLDRDTTRIVFTLADHSTISHKIKIKDRQDPT